MDAHSLPEDLVKARRAFTATYEALAAPCPGQDRAALRRRLLRLSVRIWWHPYWTTSRTGPAARVRLRELARTSTGPEGPGER
ncbi:hypothetical protein [Streptomyces camponoticapitis]|uniref:hypothetical protein n=1 Tax=Streptomyces camponoticapitis TaxID=1616125 RepID=UPI00166E6FE9|nr:hypothetical protein [Streptomyces camponoticapitis]